MVLIQIFAKGFDISSMIPGGCKLMYTSELIKNIIIFQVKLTTKILFIVNC